MHDDHSVTFLLHAGTVHARIMSKHLSSLQSMCLGLIGKTTQPAVDFLAGEDVVDTGAGENICGMLEYAHCTYPVLPNSVIDKLYACLTL